MILDTRLELPPARPAVLTRWYTNPAFSAQSRNAIAFVLFLALVVLLQVASGAYHAELAGYPDEPAHYVTSLMVREYILHPTLSPIEFARDYYYHYPKVAFGHWPPFLYVVQALWMLLFSPSRTSVFAELALTTALLAYAVYLEVRRSFGWNAGLLAGFLTICIPLVQTYTDEEMADTLLTLLCFWSAIYFARYVESERWQDSAWFGVFFALAVLTKGSGWLLALIPPVALLLTRKLRLLLRPSFWVSALIVGALCVPWQLITMQMAERGWAGGSQPSVSYTLDALRRFFLILVQIPGPVLFGLIAIGITVSVLIPMFRESVASRPAVMAALILAVWIFHSLVPAGVEDRKLIIAVPALVLFLFTGSFWLADHLPVRGRLILWRRTAVAVLAILVFSAHTFAIPHRRHYGYTEAADFITSKPDLRTATILVSSQSFGEGLLISEIAMREPRPQGVIIRATKALAEVDWNVTRYQSRFSTPTQVLNYLDARRADVVVTDTFAPAADFLHDRLLKEAIRQNLGRLHLVASFPNQSSAAIGQVRLYRIYPYR
jgi:Dolichyl-phosphate-mannose-protein mannosyltransferase